MKTNRKWNVLIIALIAVFLFGMIFPFFWIFITSFKPSGKFLATGLFGSLPIIRHGKITRRFSKKGS